MILPIDQQANLFGWESLSQVVGDSKVCTKCNNEKSLSEYGTVNGGLKRPECRKCMNEMVSIRNRLRSTVNEPPADYCCPICNKTTDQVKDFGGKRNRAWVLDHCHQSNEFRGWLCHRCNRALGGFSDDVDYLKRAIQYLQA